MSTKMSRKECLQDREIVEELTINKAQSLVYDLMDDKGASEKDLAKLFGVASVTKMLRSGSNLTIRRLAGVCFALGHEVGFTVKPLDRYRKTRKALAELEEHTAKLSKILDAGEESTVEQWFFRQQDLAESVNYAFYEDIK